MALTLMRAALRLLDRAGASLAAIHLSHAIDVAADTPIPRTVEEMEAALANLPELAWTAGPHGDVSVDTDVASAFVVQDARPSDVAPPRRG